MNSAVLASASKLRPVSVFKDSVDHPHVHQQAFGACAWICRAAVDTPLAATDRYAAPGRCNGFAVRIDDKKNSDY